MKGDRRQKRWWATRESNSAARDGTRFTAQSVTRLVVAHLIVSAGNQSPCGTYQPEGSLMYRGLPARMLGRVTVVCDPPLHSYTYSVLHDVEEQPLTRILCAGAGHRHREQILGIATGVVVLCRPVTRTVRQPFRGRTSADMAVARSTHRFTCQRAGTRRFLRCSWLASQRPATSLPRNDRFRRWR